MATQHVLGQSCCQVTLIFVIGHPLLSQLSAMADNQLLPGSGTLFQCSLHFPLYLQALILLFCHPCGKPLQRGLATESMFGGVLPLLLHPHPL